MADRHDPEALFARGFKAGSIIRLRMKNFLTYDECEFYTGPRLNIVIGPNGTGKSALTHAICLACCGSTGDVGRSSDLSKFVKHGAEGKESFAEVDILTAEQGVVTIRRVINSENKGSKWFLNRRPEKQAVVKKLVASLSIDVDNLCSFMPQDKVGNFSRFTPKEILVNTLKSIQDPEDDFSLADEQIELSTIQDTKEDYRRKRDAKQASLESSERELEGMRSEMARMERREEMIKLLSDYEIRLLAVEVNELADKFIVLQEQVNVKTARLQEERRLLGPLEERERDLRRQQTARNKAADDAITMQQRIDDVLRTRREKIGDCEIDVDSLSQELILMGAERQRKEQALDKALDKLAEEQDKNRQAQALLPTLQAQAQQKRAAVEQLQSQKADAEDRGRQLQVRCGGLRDEITMSKRGLAELQDFKQQYRQRLQRMGQMDLARGALAMLDWLDQNQKNLLETGQLRAEIFGPVAMHCSVADPACAVMLEKAVPLGSLLGFIAQNDEDAQLLKQERDRRGIKLNVFTMKNPVLQERTNYSAEELAQLGLKGYLRDQLECPDIVRSFFYIFHTLDRVLWGRGADNLTAAQQEHMCRKENNFRVYLHEVTAGRQQQVMNIVEYKGTMSRNRNAPPSTSSIGVTGRGLIMNQAGDADVTEQRLRLEQAVQEKTLDLRRAEQEQNNQQAAVRAFTDQLSMARGELKECLDGVRSAGQFQQRIAQLQRTVDDLNQQLSVSAGRERQEKERTYKEAVQRLLNTIKQTSETVQKSLANRVDREVSAALRDELSDAIREAEAALKEGRRAVADLEKDLKAAEKTCAEMEKKKVAKEVELDEIVKQSGLGHQGYAEQVYSGIETRCPEKTSVDIMARMEQLNEEINRIADNPQLQQRYAEVTTDVARLQNELKRANEEYENAEEALGKRAERWVKTVTRITEKLNVKFGAYMSELQLRGAVKLKSVGRFTDYEMQLLVSFRAGSELLELDGSRHSGGERAVATVMFLMALQDMTTSPFRVVDEINQGMDEANERLVFDRIVKSCCGDASKPQYFLVTPKLLQGLGAMRNEDVTVLLVWNGPGTGTKWVFSDILRNLSQGANHHADQPTTSSSSAGGDGAQARGSGAGADAGAGSGRGGAVVKKEAAKVKPDPGAGSSSAAAAAAASTSAPTATAAAAAMTGKRGRGAAAATTTVVEDDEDALNSDAGAWRDSDSDAASVPPTRRTGKPQVAVKRQKN